MNTRRTAEIELISRFLGPAAAAGGPFALLGLAPEDCSPVSIERALESRLDQIIAQPGGDSLEADQLRLLLHKAAEQLLDPGIISALNQIRQPSSSSSFSFTPPQTSSSPPPAISREFRTTLPTLDRYEDLKRHRRDRLVFLTLGVGVLSLIALFLLLIILLWPTAATSPPPPANTNRTSAPPASSASPSSPITSPPPISSLPQADQPTDAVSPPAPNSAQPQPPLVQDLPQLASADPLDSRSCLKQLREALALAAKDPPAAIIVVHRVYPSIATSWPDYDAATTRAMVEALVQVIYALAPRDASPELARKILTPILADADRLADRLNPAISVMQPGEVARSAWATGILSRLLRERDLAPAVASLSSQSVRRTVGLGGRSSASAVSSSLDPQSFEFGLTAALEKMPEAFLKSADIRAKDSPDQIAGTYDAWLQCLQPALSNDNARRETIIIRTLEAAMLADLDPQDDLAVYEALTRLTSALDWHSSAAAHTALINWFADERCSVSDLRIVTSIIADQDIKPLNDLDNSTAPAPASMILSIGSTSEERSRLQSRYAQFWNLSDSTDRQATLDTWLRQTREQIAETASASDPVYRLWSASVFARLNLAARAIWEGDQSASDTFLSQPDPSLAQTTSSPITKPSSNPTRGSSYTVMTNTPFANISAAGAWAERYLSAERNIPLRLQLLKELSLIPRPLSTADAQVLIESACFGVPWQVQYAAQDHVTADPDDPNVLAAMLEMMPRTPKTRTISDMISKLINDRLPPLTDPNWELAARRGLVARLLALLAQQSPEAWQEQTAARIIELYALSSTSAQHASDNSNPSSDVDAASTSFPDAAAVARTLLLRWRQQADRAAFNPAWSMSLPEIDRRAQGRRSLAQGPVQAFAAEQASIMEIMAYVVAAERPSKSAAIRAIIDQQAARSRSASHIYEQIWATEQAMTRLWAVRLGLNLESSP